MTLLEVLRLARGEMQLDVLRDRDGVLEAISRYEPSAAEAERLAQLVNIAFDSGAVGELAAAADRDTAARYAADAMVLGAIRAGRTLPRSVAQDTMDAFCTAAWQPLPASPPRQQPARPTSVEKSTPPGPGPISLVKKPQVSQPAPVQAAPPANVRRYVSTRSDILQHVFEDVEDEVLVIPRMGYGRLAVIVLLVALLAAQIAAAYFAIGLIRLGNVGWWQGALPGLPLETIRVRCHLWFALIAVQSILFVVLVSRRVLGRILLLVVLAAVFFLVPPLLDSLGLGVATQLTFMLVCFAVQGIGTDLMICRDWIR